ncbi:MAG TPA: acyl-CoA dehydrogenase family protein [Rhodothermales bacterium]|nr:acyl-CoA dehydrogenase family protein [Rhodothermales bacterium]
MDFSLTDDQQALRDKFAAFAHASLNDSSVESDVLESFRRDRWMACAREGILGLNIPKAYGGSGYDILSTIAALEGLGYGCRENALPFALNSQMWSVHPAILKFGTEDQRQKWLPRLCSGEKIGAFGITEEQTGSDAYAMEARARKVDDGYVLSGRKAYVTNAPVCDLAVVFAVTDPDAGRWGVSCFVVERGTDGFETSPARNKMGMRTAQMGDLLFEDCLIPTESRLGPEGVGVSMFTTAMESERGYIFASQVGRMRKQLEEAIAYATERKAFGRSIGGFQSVSNRIANMKLRLDTARMLLYRVAWLEEQGRSVQLEAALAKLHLSECFVESSLDFIRIHGARGYVTEFEVERDLRDGVGGLIYSGTSDIQRNIIARMLGLKP